MTTQVEPRKLYTIAADIRANWPRVNYAARPYLDAMSEISLITDDYYFDTAREIVSRFLSNSGSWRGDHARRIKAELKEMLK